jgi:Skp family chaperone for outer membrane proteins
MAKAASANTNSPSEDDVQAAVANIEQCYNDLASERGIYMSKCKRIRETMSNDYDKASDQGISKKLLKRIIKERELERKIGALTDDLEDDERNEHQMLIEKLGEFANTPLGAAALAKAKGADVLAQAGA